MFLQLDKRGTIVDTETNRYLRKKGIVHYSATGVGEKIAWKSYRLYQYVLAINANFLKHDMLYALNIIGSALTSSLSRRRSETKAEALSTRAGGRWSKFSISGKLMSTCGRPLERRRASSSGRRCSVCGPNTTST